MKKKHIYDILTQIEMQKRMGIDASGSWEQVQDS